MHPRNRLASHSSSHAPNPNVTPIAKPNILAPPLPPFLHSSAPLSDINPNLNPIQPRHGQLKDLPFPLAVPAFAPANLDFTLVQQHQVWPPPFPFAQPALDSEVNPSLSVEPGQRRCKALPSRSCSPRPSYRPTPASVLPTRPTFAAAAPSFSFYPSEEGFAVLDATHEVDLRACWNEEREGLSKESTYQGFSGAGHVESRHREYTQEEVRRTIDPPVSIDTLDADVTLVELEPRSKDYDSDGHLILYPQPEWAHPQLREAPLYEVWEPKGALYLARMREVERARMNEYMVRIERSTPAREKVVMREGRMGRREKGEKTWGVWGMWGESWEDVKGEERVAYRREVKARKRAEREQAKKERRREDRRKEREIRTMVGAWIDDGEEEGMKTVFGEVRGWVLGRLGC
ncbi:hypothetical protein Hypma_003081 [Hypsizygus marmoreus]|uniref:Uncharacterized protein n=1 Tax=Hypsizygus marmoreus TaxID=39966 RepID=A0A369J797_HYPMA|nr:hypothetical protein Hypma_003081 [Hypsizygus marmoreus]